VPALFLNDLRYAVRRLAKSPGFAAMAVIALGLGIGANSNIFSFVNAYLLNPLPSVKNADRLVFLECERRGSTTGVSYPDFLDWTQQSRAFSDLAATQDVLPILSGRGEPERIHGERVSAGYFNVFTVRPAIGRAFLPAEMASGGEPVILLSDGFWQRRFGGRADILGQSLVLDGVSYRVVGVMPRRYRTQWSEDAFWMPLASDTMQAARGRRVLNVFARLKPAVSIATAQGEMETIAARLRLAYPETNGDMRVSVRDFIRMVGEGPRQSVSLMVGVCAFVLLISCSNVTNLQLARATSRTGEVAVRIAIGASRWRIIRQVLLESVLVALAGGLLGLGISVGGAKILVASIPATYRPLNDDFLDYRVVLYTAAVALLTGLVSGIAPAFQVSRVGIADTLKEGGRGNSSGSRGGLRNALVVVEVSLALVLLLASGLLIQSFVKMQQIDPGFRVDNLLTATIWLPDAKYPRPEQRTRFFHDLADRAAAIPGVQSAAVSTSVPMTGGGAGSNFVVEGKPLPPAGHELFGRIRSITPGYLQAIGIPLRSGRYFTAQDDEKAQRVAIVNERLAQQFFPGEDPIGKRLKWSRDPQASAPWMTIVGIIGDVKTWGLASPAAPEMYAPFAQEPRQAATLVIRTAGADPVTVASAMRAEVRALDRDQPVTAVETMRRIVEESMTISRLMTVLMAIFASIALAMAAMGIYGVISYSVAQRTHEVGIRMALGAGAGNVVRLILKQALWTVGIGVAIGVPGAAAVTTLLQFLLYGVGARDPLTFAAGALLLAIVGALASYLPARRATRVDPVIALRCE
jgi:putative ABC transport system permease protein